MRFSAFYFIWFVAFFVIGVLLFSYSVEIMQYFNVVELLGLSDYKLARIVIGTSFAWVDMLAYTAGAVIIAVVEYYRFSKTDTV